jgi:uncharacterized protein (TIGR02646 family)
MKYINKSNFNSPQDFEKWKKKHKGVSWKDFTENPEYCSIKINLGAHLRISQGNICCYCERRINEYNSHIEHDKPKDSSQFPELMYDYNNLLASCNGNKEQTKHSCGHKKQNWYNPERVSPLSENCEIRITYTAEGFIVPKDKNDEIALETIHVLGLDNEKFIQLRSNVIQELQNSKVI